MGEALAPSGPEPGEAGEDASPGRGAAESIWVRPALLPPQGSGAVISNGTVSEQNTATLPVSVGGQTPTGTRIS